jgi:hypothetical protein
MEQESVKIAVRLWDKAYQMVFNILLRLAKEIKQSKQELQHD